MTNQLLPSLFGLNKTNRDFSQKDAWGKNQFNSSFPAAMCCYLAAKKVPANYLSIANREFKQKFITIDEVFGIEYNDNETYFAFESQYTPYQKYIIGCLPRTDLVIQRESTGECLSGLEVKLTALPDHTTCNLDEKLYGTEIVVRPDTIVYLACSVASVLSSELGDHIPDIEIDDWSDAKQVLGKVENIIEAVEKLSIVLEPHQRAFLLQPIWKTMGKSPELAEDCLDVFIWSNAGFMNIISRVSRGGSDSITRQTRTAIWLFKMLSDIKKHGKFNHSKIIDNLSYNTRNDKAFASSGTITNRYMSCPRLIKPIIKKDEIKNIILGGGQNLLSPERRFDSIVFNSPGLFE
jgi:type II restriction enzyme